MRADKPAVKGSNLSWEVRQEAGRFVGARAADVGLGGPLWSPVGGEAIVFLQDVSQGNRTRATIKALPSALHPPSPLRIIQANFVRLMLIRADKSVVGTINRLLRPSYNPFMHPIDEKMLDTIRKSCVLY